MPLNGDRVVVVTGASRGAGRGIATALGATGATVYVTGRTREVGESPLPGTVQATADAITAAGGRGIAAPLLLANGEGLVVNTSSFGGRIYMHGPAYGAGKAAVDKMAHDMAVDFRPHNVAVVSIWMGLLLTDIDGRQPPSQRVFFGEPTTFGDAVVE